MYGIDDWLEAAYEDRHVADVEEVEEDYYESED